MTLIVILCIVAIVILSPFIVACIVLFPYLCMVIKRAIMLSHLKRQAKARGYAYKPLRKAVFMSLNTSCGYDFLLVRRDRVLAVKLWSAIESQSEVFVRADRTYLERTVVPQPLDTGASPSKNVRVKKHRFPSLEDNVGDTGKAELRRVLLYYPQHKAAYVLARGRRVPLKMGVSLFGARVCDEKSISRFM